MIVTLTTDMGLSDYYVAAIKGALYTADSQIKIVDITHSVRPFDVAEAAFQISSCYKNFPQGTIHLVGVDTEPIINFSGSDGAFPSILEFEGQYFISNDNGFFGAFLNGNSPDNFWRIEDLSPSEDLFKFPTKNLFARIAGRILKGENIDSFGKKSTYYRDAFKPAIISAPNFIKGHVVYIDSFGNAITNIRKDDFVDQGEDVPFVINFKSKDNFIDQISISYNEVSEGDKVAVFNENGWLEIAINRGANRTTGGASQLFGLKKNDVVSVKFTPLGSHSSFQSLF